VVGEGVPERPMLAMWQAARLALPDSGAEGMPHPMLSSVPLT
jgi:hypothetical protein